VLNLAMTLGLEVIAEGAESQAQISYLESLDCKFCQGYFYSRPVPADQALHLPRILTSRVGQPQLPPHDHARDSHAA